ncbi:MAG: DUF3826 domain-containing protein [Ferruginibacter sp.]
MKKFLLVHSNIQSANSIAGKSFSFLLSATKLFIVAVILLCSGSLKAQNVADTGYQKVLADRTAKIVNTLNISDAALYKKVQQQLTDQYLKLNKIQDDNKATVAAIKAKALSKEETDLAVKQEDEKKATALKQLHADFIAQLKTTLTENQIDKIKDGMTYSILQVTWTAYLDEIPRLTQVQKDKMYAWLIEARELAMDEGSSEKKHAVFGKYKGRINNYLSAEGYDMKKEGEEWAKRIQAAKDAKQTQN